VNNYFITQASPSCRTDALAVTVIRNAELHLRCSTVLHQPDGFKPPKIYLWIRPLVSAATHRRHFVRSSRAYWGSTVQDLAGTRKHDLRDVFLLMC